MFVYVSDVVRYLSYDMKSFTDDYIKVDHYLFTSPLINGGIVVYTSCCYTLVHCLFVLRTSHVPYSNFFLREQGGEGETQGGLGQLASDVTALDLTY